VRRAEQARVSVRIKPDSERVNPANRTELGLLVGALLLDQVALLGHIPSLTEPASIFAAVALGMSAVRLFRRSGED
jgi:hypothetical protein